MRHERKPQELLTCANAILGQGQLSLAKYLLIVAWEDAPGLDGQADEACCRHRMERAAWTRDLHFQTATYDRQRSITPAADSMKGQSW